MDGCDLNREGLSSPRLATAGSGSGGGGSPESSPERDLANGNGRGLDKSDELDPGSRAMASDWVTVEQKLGRLAMAEELRCYAVREFQWRKSTRLRSTSTRVTTRNFRLQQNGWGASTAGCPRESY